MKSSCHYSSLSKRHYNKNTVHVDSVDVKGTFEIALDRLASIKSVEIHKRALESPGAFYHVFKLPQDLFKTADTHCSAGTAFDMPTEH